ncbi:hypothetical protein [Hydrogenophaga sp.]|uniref:hypothetical protein n=1 Tax=Hydrogenophaga sp. TaxID=1904254 RepID=UPI00391A4CEF
MKISGWQYALIVSFLLLLACIPIFSVDQPPLADYPNHLARVHIWLNYGTSSEVPNVVPVWAIQPNMAFELFVALLSVFMPLEQAGRWFVVLTMLSIAVGPAVLGRSIWGTFTIWSLLPVFFIYNRLFFWGFLGYLFSLGVAFGLSSFWVASYSRLGRVSWFICASLLSVFVLALHLYAYAVFCLIVMFLTFRAVGNSGNKLNGKVLWLVYRLIPLALALPVFAVGAPVFEATYYVAWGPYFDRFASFVGLMVGSDIKYDLLLMAVFLLLIGVLVFRLLTWSGVDKWILSCVLLLFLLQLVMPSRLLSSYGADQRLAIPIALLLGVAVSPARVRFANFDYAILVGLVLVYLIRIGGIQSDWVVFQKRHADLVEIYRKLPMNANVVALVCTSNPYGLPRVPLTEHFGFAVLQRNVFWPGLFAYPVHGAQTIAFSNPKAISSGVAKLQKVPLEILNEVVSGVINYSDYDLASISRCYQFMVVIPEDGAIASLPEVSFFGEIYYKGKFAVIYTRSGINTCDW